jgi:hypothetical protein
MSSLSLNYPALDKAMSEFERTNPDYNNPGAIMFGDFAQSYGATGAGPTGLAKFPTPAQGYAAEDALIGSYARKGFTLRDLINKWAPPTAKGNSTESTNNYVNSVAGKVGASPDTKISDIVSGVLGTLTGVDPGGMGGTFTKANIVDGIGTYLSRIVAVVLGLICIFGGIILFKPVSDTVITTAKTAAKVAAV